MQIRPEAEAKADALVFRSIHVPAHLVGRRPKLRLEVQAGAVAGISRFGFVAFFHKFSLFSHARPVRCPKKQSLYK